MLLWRGGLLFAGGPGTGLTEQDVERSSTGASGPTAPDPEIIAALRGTMGTDPDVATATRQADLAWESLVLREQGIQRRLIQNYRTLLTAWAQAWARYKAGAAAYGQAYLNAYNGSDALQQTARDWQTRQVGAKAIDIALALILLVRGVAQLGSAGFRWLRGLRGGGEAAGVAVARAEAVIEGSPALTELGLELAQTGRRGELVQLASMADEAGIVFEQWFMGQKAVMDGFGQSILARTQMLRLFEIMALNVMKARGWVQATAAQTNVVTTMLVNGRGLVAGRAVLSAEQVAAFRTLVGSTDDFFTFVAKWYDEVSEVAGHGAAATTDFYALICSADDVAFLRMLWTAIQRSGDDLTRLPGILRKLLGPAKVASISSGAALTATGATIAATSGAAGPQGPVQLGAVGSLDVYMGQYGITNDGFFGNLWDFVTSPVETTGGIWHTLWAQSEWNEFMANHSGDLAALGPGVADALGALTAMQNLMNSNRLGDANGPIGGPAQDLRGVLQVMQQTFDGAPNAWQDAHRAEYDAKRSHIQQKLTQIGQTLAALQEFSKALTGFIQPVEQLRRTPDGTHRDAVEMLDPDMAVALTQISFLLEGAAWRAFGGGQQQQPLTPRQVERAGQSWDELVGRKFEGFESNLEDD